MKKPSRFLRILGAAGLMISLLAATIAPVAAQPAAPADEGLQWLFDLSDGAFRTGDNAIYYPWVANGEDFGLGASQTSISVQNLEGIDTEIGIFVGDGAGDFTLVTSAFLSAFASKTFSASDLGIAEGSGAPVAVLAATEIEFIGEADEDFPEVDAGEALVETAVILSKPEGVEGDFTQVDACVVNDGAGNPVGFVVAAAFTFDGVSYEAGDVFAMPFTSGDLQEILEDAQDGDELVNPFGGLNDDADCDDEGIAGELGESLVVPTVIGGVAKQAAAGATLPTTTEADTAVSGYNALNGSEVFQFDEWYLPIVQTNCGPGGCWDTVIRVANLSNLNNAVTIRFFPADDGSGSLQTGFQIQDLVNGGATWNVNLGDLVPEGWVGTAHIFSDGGVFAMADRYKVGYNMWITNTGSSADFENLAQVDNAQGNYALFAPHVLMDYYGWNTGINVANLVNADNNVSIQYFNMFGNATQVLNQRLAAHGMTYFYDPSIGAQDNNSQDVTNDPNAGVVGSAIIWSDEPVAAAVDATKYPETDPNGGEDVFQATSYSATQNIFTWQAVPLVQKGAPTDGMGDTSGINIMNPNATAVTAEVYWVNPSGFLADNFGVGGVTIPGFANGFVYTLWQHNLPNGFTGAAQVIADQPVAAVSANVNYEVDGDGSAIFNAFNPCGFFRVGGECSFGDPFAPGGQSVTKTFIVDDLDGEDEETVGDAEGIAGVDFSIVSTGEFGFQRDGVSGTEGAATFSNVPVGTYELVVNDVPEGFELPEGAVDQFVVTEGSDVVLINELGYDQSVTKTVCVTDFIFDPEDVGDVGIGIGGGSSLEQDDEDEVFALPCSDTNLAGVNVAIFEVTGLDVALLPVVDNTPVFDGVTGEDGSITTPLAPGEYILCLYDTDGEATTVPGGETVSPFLPEEMNSTILCAFEELVPGIDSPFGDIFTVEAGVDVELENAVFLNDGVVNIFVGDDADPLLLPDASQLAQAPEMEPVEGVQVCLFGGSILDQNFSNQNFGGGIPQELCGTSDANGWVEIPVEVLDPEWIQYLEEAILDFDELSASTGTSLQGFDEEDLDEFISFILYIVTGGTYEVATDHDGPVCLYGGELTAIVIEAECGDSFGERREASALLQEGELFFDGAIFYNPTADVAQDGYLDDVTDGGELRGSVDLTVGVVGAEGVLDVNVALELADHPAFTACLYEDVTDVLIDCVDVGADAMLGFDQGFAIDNVPSGGSYYLHLEEVGGGLNVTTNALSYSYEADLLDDEGDPDGYIDDIPGDVGAVNGSDELWDWAITSFDQGAETAVVELDEGQMDPF